MTDQLHRQDKAKSKLILYADLALLGTAAVWGSSYPVLKTGLNNLPMLTLLGWRFTIASVILILIFHRQIFPLRWNDIKAGLITGFFLFGGFYFFAAGLRYTEASRSGFIVSLFVIMVPFMSAIMEKRWPDKKVLIGASLSLIGLALMSLTSFDFALGDLLILISAFFYGAQLVATGIYAKGVTPVRLVIYQLVPCGLIFLVLAYLQEPRLESLPGLGLFSIVYLAVMGSAIALFFQTWAQKYTPADHAAVIYTSEPVFGAIFSYLALGELLGWRGLLGGIFILAGMLWVELGPGKKAVVEDIIKA